MTVPEMTKYRLFHNQSAWFVRGYEAGDTLKRGFEGEIPDSYFGDEAVCEAVFMRHNRDDRPDGQTAPSLSVGDVVVLVGRGAYTVESIGFTAVSTEALMAAVTE